MNIKSVKLEIVNNTACLRVYGSQFLNGYTTIESVPSANGETPKSKTLETLRKYGSKHAKRFNVKFIDDTK